MVRRTHPTEDFSDQHEKVEIVIMAGSARPTFNFSDHNSRGGCSTENGKLFNAGGWEGSLRGEGRGIFRKSLPRPSLQKYLILSMLAASYQRSAVSFINQNNWLYYPSKSIVIAPI
jgi:hypothetical protein